MREIILVLLLLSGLPVHAADAGTASGPASPAAAKPPAHAAVSDEPVNDSGKASPRRHPRGPRILELQEPLDLTDEQAAAIRNVYEAARPAFEKNREDMRAQRKALRELLREGYDEKAVKRIAAEQGRLYAERIELRSRRYTRIQNLLSEQQRIQLRRLAGEHFRKRRAQRAMKEN